MASKTILAISVLLLGFNLNSKSQTTRYFEFTTSCASGYWQDSSFIAAVSDSELIDTVLTELALPLTQRRFINGPIDYGNDGYNHNASHWFLWHFIINQWMLVDNAIELCDGCPYSSVDADTAMWISNIGQFCPWSARPVREILNPSGISETNFENEIIFYPNPSFGNLNFKLRSLNNISVTIFNSIGQELMTTILTKQKGTIDISNIQSGLYFLKIQHGNKMGIKKLIVEPE